MSRIIVAGSINMDVVAFTAQQPRPGETVEGRALQFFPGGKGANQAVASAKLGADTSLVGRVGNDSFAEVLLSFLRDQRVDVASVSGVSGVPTGTALIVVGDDGENSIVVVPGANHTLTSADIATIPATAEDVLVCQLEIPNETVRAFLRRAREVGAPSILNPAPAKHTALGLLELADYLVVNETELELFAGIGRLPNEAKVVEAARQLRSHREQTIVVTLGAEGVVAVSAEDTVRVPGRAVPAIDTTGAGDCFTGAFATQILRRASLEDALSFANLAASICVTRPGAGPSMPSIDDIHGLLEHAA